MRALCLEVAATDRTFGPVVWRGRRVWQGRCIHCQSHLLIEPLGTLLGEATLEHILPQSHGGTNAPENLALACRRCNNQKGARLDILGKGDPRLMSVVERLSAKRRSRVRSDIRPQKHGPLPDKGL